MKFRNLKRYNPLKSKLFGLQPDDIRQDQGYPGPVPLLRNSTTSF